MHRTITRLSAALFTTALVAVALPASAHVSVSSTDASQGGFGKAVFRVPNESDTAMTTKIVVTLPAEAPFAFVSAGSKPGWTVEIAKEKLAAPVKTGDFEVTEAVRTITWTATDGGIPVGQFDEFALSAGPFPDDDSISFTAQQSYDDGEVVDWDEEQTGDTEPAHPAPVLTLADATDDEHAHGASETEHAHDDSDDSNDSDSAAAWWLGGVALIVALASLVVSLRQNRRRA